MKFLSAIALPALVAPLSAYTVGGGFNSRRSRGSSYFTPEQAERIRRQQQQVDRAFADLASEFSSNNRCSSPRCGDVGERNDEAVRQQREWLNRAFGMAVDVASGLSSPWYQVQDDDEAFKVSLDVPGVKASDIDISVDETDGKTLNVKGQREVAAGVELSRTAKFSKSFVLDPATDTDNITAQLSNGVLTISAPKDPKKVEEKTKRIPVEQVADEDIPVVKGVEEANDDSGDVPNPDPSVNV